MTVLLLLSLVSLLSLPHISYALTADLQGASMTTTPQLSDDVFSDPPIFVNRNDIDAGTILITSTSPGRVSTSTDLSGFIAAKMRHDPRILSIRASSDEVRVTYSDCARFFGYFRTEIPVTVSTDNERMVHITYPWYGTFASDVSNLAERIKSHLSTTEVVSNETLNPAQQAQLIDGIVEALSEQYVIDSVHLAKL